MAYLSTLSAAQTTGLYHPHLLSNDVLQAAMLRRPSIYWTSVVCLCPSGLQHYISCPGAQRCQGLSHSHKKTTSVDLSLTQILIDYDLISVRFIVFF